MAGGFRLAGKSNDLVLTSLGKPSLVRIRRYRPAGVPMRDAISSFLLQLGASPWLTKRRVADNCVVNEINSAYQDSASPPSSFRAVDSENQRLVELSAPDR